MMENPKPQLPCKNLSDVFKWGLKFNHDVLIQEFETYSYRRKKAGIAALDSTVPISPESDFGVEVEIENAANLLIADGVFWNTHSDGSLRNHGIEFVSSIIPACWLKACIMSLFPAFQTHGEFSERTSIHIHLNMRSKTIDQILGFILTYLIFERELFKFANDARRNSHYCVPLLETSQLQSIFQYWKVNWKGISTWTKYSAVNLAHLQDFGTLEFRHLPGTKDADKVLQWCDLLMRLDNYCRKESHEIIMTRAWNNKTITDKQNWLKEIFQEEASLLMPFCLDTAEHASDMCRLKQLFSDQLALHGKTSIISARSVFGRMIQKQGKSVKKLKPILNEEATLAPERDGRELVRQNPWIVTEWSTSAPATPLDRFGVQSLEMTNPVSRFADHVPPPEGHEWNDPNHDPDPIDTLLDEENERQP